MRRVNSDDINFAHLRVSIAVHFGPAESSKSGFIPVHQKALWVVPVLGLASSNDIARPSALLGVRTESCVVNCKPRIFVYACTKWSRHEISGEGELFIAQRKRPAHLD